MAAHSDPKTTKLYDRTSDELSLDEVERIVIWILSVFLDIHFSGLQEIQNSVQSQ